MKIWTKCSKVLYPLLIALETNYKRVHIKFLISSYQFPLLQKFLVRLINNEPSLKSDRVKRLLLSFAQNLFFAVHNGKNLTPKNVLLPLYIKSLSNNTELITTVSRLGHGISYTKLSEITTEVAYSIINVCQEWYFYQNNSQ